MKPPSIVLLLLFLLSCIGPGCVKDSSSKEAADNTSGESKEKKTAATTPRPGRGSEGGGVAPGKAPSRDTFASAASPEDANKLRSLAMAIHNYHAARKQFPWSNAGNANAKNLSWRVKVLPYLEALELYNAFNPDEPWDSATNKPLIEKGKQYFALSNGHLVSAVLDQNPPKAFREILDGTSNTIMLIENPDLEPTEWSKPVDTTPAEAIKLVKSMDSQQFVLTAFFDGSTRRAYGVKGRDISEDEIKAPFGHRDFIVQENELFKSK